MGKKLYVREYYMNKIDGFIDSDLIKVITGIRRCGKSCFQYNTFPLYLQVKGINFSFFLIIPP